MLQIEYEVEELEAHGLTVSLALHHAACSSRRLAVQSVVHLPRFFKRHQPRKLDLRRSSHWRDKRFLGRGLECSGAMWYSALVLVEWWMTSCVMAYASQSVTPTVNM